METLLWLVPILPFTGAFILMIFGAYMSKRTVGVIGCASVGLSWLLAMIITIMFLAGRIDSIHAVLYPWIPVDGLNAAMGLYLDPLALIMMLVVTFVAFIIHLYASQSMYNESGYSRFFAYLNLFVGSMLILVLADNLLLLYLGWEGVGLCSYLLIGFWYKDPANVRAANKAFIVTRVGDTALAVGLFLLYREFGTLNIQTILGDAGTIFAAGSALVTAIALLILGGAVGKSGQVPLQVWLPDAMAGPTPVSALIHAATMVTAGVYLIARLHTIFELTPLAMLVVAIVGTITLFYSGFTALVQRDIKRILAYSTIGQIGYMFLALGVGAWAAAIFHLFTHAFFKALLFLAAGVVIDAQHHEHDIFKFGGLKNRLPVAFWTFTIGAASLAALPPVTAGFYSKDAILFAAYTSDLGSIWFLVIGLLAALITAAYSFRAVFLTFFGEQKMEVSHYPGTLMKLALITLSVFSLFAGYIWLPELMGGFNPLGRFLGRVFPALPAEHASITVEFIILGLSVSISLLGVVLAYFYFKGNRWAWVVDRSPAAQAIYRFFYTGWGFDWLYDRLFVRPYIAISTWNRRDFIDKVYDGLAAATKYANLGLSATQTGRVRDYAVGLVLGAIVVAVVALLR